jgi:2-(1,2-epoxy-1,2-dihydrophenyl)acetyl-CoA isomerase
MSADPVAHVSVTGPIDMAWAEAFRDRVRALATQDGLRVVVLAAEGRFFSPGGDLAWMEAQDDPEAGLLALAGTFHEGIAALAALPVPVVARVHGPAAGGGLSLMLGADIAIAAESAFFTMAYSGVGLSPDGGGSWLLPRIVGVRRATEIILTNRKIGAAEAVELGLVTRAVPDAELDAAVDALVAQLAAGPTAAYAASKRLLARSVDSTFSDQLAAEAASIAQLAGAPTGQEGIAAFLARRAPRFPAG